ncbi:hypothetical protein [Aquimarina brevivitae]|uniref:Uncharacterized protein n=1 Tax=Aquimarina brevivitae TaxID=323412 RepID=A0A4Q7P289_9FLAO|nr:hypothetical protein [Aquimarina brevivitae]RZS93864.1 hypothetical protein EV197_2445 [Aquimarina brevivitae]
MDSSLITADSFIHRLSEGRMNSSSSYTVNQDVILNVENITWELGIIKNTIFTRNVSIYGEVNSGLVFHNCTFNAGIIFRGITSENYSHNINDSNSVISFYDCKANNISFADGCNLQRGITISEHSVVEKVMYYNSSLKGTFKISGSEISNLFDINLSKITSLIIQSRSTVKSLRINSLIGDISLLKSTFTDNVNLWNVEIQNSLTLNYNTFEDTFEIKASKISAFNLHGDTFKKKARLENRFDNAQVRETYLNKLYLTDVNLIEGFEFDGMGKELLELKLPITTSFAGVLRFIGWKIKSTNISGINQNLKLIFTNTLFEKLTFNDFSNFANVTFDQSGANQDSDEETFIIAANTDFGNSKFNEFNFNSFDFINFSNTSLNDIVTINVIWFDESKIRIDSLVLNSSKSFRRIREVYRQIKQSLISQGNQIDSLEFKAKEMRAYRNELNAIDKEGGKYSLPDKIIMKVNQTNNYGLSWWKPVWITLLLTLAFYIIELPLFSKKINYTPATNWEDLSTTLCEFWNNFDVYWQMLNPARKFSSVYGYNDIAFLYFLDFLHRLILGILIFQIIKGFRRFSSK